MGKIKYLVILFFLTQCVSTSEKVELTYLDKSKVKLRMNVYKTNKLPAPTVIVMHGCGGISQDHHFWGKSIQSWGFNSVVLDFFLVLQMVMCAADLLFQLLTKERNKHIPWQVGLKSKNGLIKKLV